MKIYTEGSTQYTVEMVPIAKIVPGDTIVHRNGHLVTVCKENIHFDLSLGILLFGDTFKSQGARVPRANIQTPKR